LSCADTGATNNTLANTASHVTILNMDAILSSRVRVPTTCQGACLAGGLRMPHALSKHPPLVAAGESP
jgi:hypothetical protein